MFPLACLPDALSKLFYLGLPGPVFDKEVVVRLTLAATTSPASVRPGSLRDFSQVGADSRVAREELEKAASDSLIFSLEVFSLVGGIFVRP